MADRKNSKKKNTKGNVSPQSSPGRAAVLQDNIDLCPDCQNHVKDEDKGINCDQCKQWWHARCAKVTNKEYEVLGKSSNFRWYCKECSCKERDVEKQPNQIMSQQLTNMMQMMTSILERLDKIERNHSMDKEIEDLVEAKVQETVAEMQEKEKRKLNLVIFNLPESQGVSKEEVKENDTKSIQNIVNSILPETEAKEIKIKDPVRLGPANLGKKPRILKFSVNSEEAKNSIIKNAVKVNKKETANKDKVYINPDYTNKERDLNKKLRQELKERIGKGEENLVIRNWKVVERNPQVGKENTEVKRD